MNLRIQSECGEIWTRKTPNTDAFYAVVIYVRINDILKDSSLSNIGRLLQGIKITFLKSKKFVVKKYLHFGISAYDQNKHCRKNSYYDPKPLPEIWLFLRR